MESLKKHPEMLETIKDLLDVTEGVKGIEIADEVELALIPEVRGLGKKCLKDWAKQQTKENEELARKKRLKQHSKKSSLAHNLWRDNYRGLND